MKRVVVAADGQGDFLTYKYERSALGASGGKLAIRISEEVKGEYGSTSTDQYTVQLPDTQFRTKSYVYVVKDEMDSIISEYRLDEYTSRPEPEIYPTTKAEWEQALRKQN